jgi:hypothetical protein
MISLTAQQTSVSDRKVKSVEINEKTIKIQLRASFYMKHCVFFTVLCLFFCGCVSKRPALVNEEKEETHQQEPVRAGGNTQEGLTQPVDTEKPEEEIAFTGQKSEYEKKETVSIINIIEELEQCYKESDFKKWKSFLTPKYKERYSDSQSLKEEGWDAVDVESFFHLLVETRKTENINTLPISRVEFLNENKALVYVFFGDEEFPEPQHTFVRINGKWYKGLREEKGE